MKSTEIRSKFLDFFKRKGHLIVASAPLVNKNDPTLMFVNSGMAPFKDNFLGNQKPLSPRIADTQKCLRVSGKHNDLEDVGMDGTHHTLFEMLGNWSFGDYFKEEAIAWSWELLTEEYKIPKDRLYATVFGGDEAEKLEADDEAKQLWLKYLPEERILYGNKKDNFWEMGDVGPCGPCSEIHVDLRSDEERAEVLGRELVNKDHPLVVEIWNNVFMQFERKADKSLVVLPSQHVDTGMGFERLCMVLQGKDKTYNTDVFSPFIDFISQQTGIKYTDDYSRDAKSDIAMRVLADHVRAISFVIADGQLPSNTGAGYVVRRILRRAVRYYFSFLNVKEPFLYKLVSILANQMKAAFPELASQQEFVGKVVLEEERSFLRTLETGLKRLDAIEVKGNILDGEIAFELFDTFGFPIDLTELILSEKGISVDMGGFNAALQRQKERARNATARTVGDWTELLSNPSVDFLGYDYLAVSDAEVVKYRTVEEKGRTIFQIVLNRTPFYPEGGGQVGDSGILYFEEGPIRVLDTKKENDLIIHYLERLPEDFGGKVRALVDAKRRSLTENNHSATHLVQAALRQVLGSHIQQRGSLNNEQYLRFDFSHFQKVTEEELDRVEQIVNEKIRLAIPIKEDRNIPIAEAQKAGAMMLFGEKYGDQVRMITFDPNFSIELCGGTHVSNTASIGLFKFTTETSVAAGVRRIEAVTSEAAERYLNGELEMLNEVRSLMKNPKDLAGAIKQMQDENRILRKELEQFYVLQAKLAKANIQTEQQTVNGLHLLSGIVELGSADALKQLAHDLRKDATNALIVVGAVIDGKPQLAVAITDDAIASRSLHAGNIIRELAKHIQGGGGGQPFFATAGGANPSGLGAAVEASRDILAKH